MTDVESYVAVGPGDLSVTVTTDTFNTGVKAFAILFGLGLFIIVGLAIYFAYQGFLLPPPPAPLPITTPNSQLQINRGAANSATSPPKQIDKDASSLSDETTCSLSSQASWSEEKDSCECEDPFFGPMCSFEKHDHKYFALGTPQRDNLCLSILEETFTKRKSFDNANSCSEKCDSNSDCIGFIYEKGHCTLLKDNVTVTSGFTIPYFPDEDTTLYMRSRSNIHFEDRVFLAGFQESIPPRFWLVTESDNYAQLAPYQITPLNFVPKIIKYYGLLTGIYCRHKFSPEDIDILLSRGDTSECYIHRYNTPLNVPVDWIHAAKNGHLYTVYI